VSLYNASVTELVRVKGRWLLSRCNDVDHLVPDFSLARA